MTPCKSNMSNLERPKQSPDGLFTCRDYCHLKSRYKTWHDAFNQVMSSRATSHSHLPPRRKSQHDQLRSKTIVCDALRRVCLRPIAIHQNDQILFNGNRARFKMAANFPPFNHACLGNQDAAAAIVGWTECGRTNRAIEKFLPQTNETRFRDY
jgi:hypothetical protein